MTEFFGSGTVQAIGILVGMVVASALMLWYARGLDALPERPQSMDTAAAHLTRVVPAASKAGWAPFS